MANASDAGASTSRGGAQPQQLPKRRVAVIDNSRDSADSLAVLLRLLGQDVHVSYDGASALAELPTFDPAVVLMDIGMPGMDGYEVARRMRSTPELKDAVLIALTGWGQPEDRRLSAEAGFDHHVVKPLECKALCDLLQQPPRRL